jgi:DNA (cytosine-5)-methyltransferase 1
VPAEYAENDLVVAFIGVMDDATANVAPTMRSLSTGPDGHKSGSHGLAIATASGARRLTPRECERLQSFPDDYTLIPGNGADGQRYKALGNSMAVPVMRWIGQRIEWWGGS